ncbi:MAG: hypothetical protein GY754_09060 [bacterium]|nr:hypothetical protein [bacterium]
MRINDFFNLKRFMLLIKKDFYTQYKTYVMALGAIFSILFIVNISSILSSQHWNFNHVFYPLTLFIGGFIFTSQSFSELNQEQSRIFYLTIPASSLEKLISKLMITSFGYIVVSLVLYFLFSVILFLINSGIFGFAHPVFNPYHPVILRSIGVYFVTQSLFLFGAVYFRKNAFMKTVVWVFVLTLVYTAFLTGISYVFYKIISFNKHIYLSMEIFDAMFQEVCLFPPVMNGFSGIVFYSIRILFWFVLAPLFWTISYFRLKEIEV